MYLPCFDALKYTSTTAIHSKPTSFQVKMLKVACIQNIGAASSRIPPRYVWSRARGRILGEVSHAYSKVLPLQDFFPTVPSNTSLGRDSYVVYTF